jgi:hypothetical protein
LLVAAVLEPLGTGLAVAAANTVPLPVEHVIVFPRQVFHHQEYPELTKAYSPEV